jgi:hypothetical protein
MWAYLKQNLPNIYGNKQYLNEEHKAASYNIFHLFA